MNRYLVSGGLAALLLLAVDRVATLHERIRELEETPRAESVLVNHLSRRLEALRAELAQTSQRLEDDRASRELSRRIAELEGVLRETDQELATHGARLRDWESKWEGREPDVLDSRLQEVRSTLEARWKDLDEIALSAARIAQEDREKLAAIDRSLAPLTRPRDVDRMWQDLVGPVVQLAGDSTVGSGVLLQSQPSADGEGSVTHLLTSWHVVRDIYGSRDPEATPVTVKIYLENGGTAHEDARMLAYDVALDIALLELETERPLSHGARLASRERLSEVQVFDSVYAVGCPLGNDPIPTAGEVAATHHVVDNSSYWMISAPTYIGNSGGGIFDAQTHELIGIFSKIYTHGSMRSTIVPHMGLVTPLTKVYQWLDGAGYAHLEPRGSRPAGAGGGEPKMAAATSVPPHAPAAR